MGRSRGPLLRGKTGCLCCRRRRKKCDEVKPSCRACIRNHLICVWPPKDETLSGSGVSKPGANYSQGLDEDEGFTGSPSPNAEKDVIRPGSPKDAEESDLMPRLPLLDGIDDPVLASLPPDSRLLLEHYYHRTADVMSARARAANPYVTQLIPIGFSNNLILQTILVLSGVHYGEDVSKSCQATTWSHYGQLMKSIKTELTRYVTDSQCGVVPLLIATMMLLFVENARIDSYNELTTHIRASRQLLLTALELPESKLDNVTRRFLIETYAFTIVLSDVSIGDKNGSHMLEDVAALLPSMHASSEATTYGFPIDLIQLIHEVSLLLKRRQNELDISGFVSDDTVLAISKLQKTIKSWKSDSTSSSTIVCGKIYQQALLLYLDSAANGNIDKLDPTLDLEYVASVQKAFEILEILLDCLPASAPIATFLCWPLAVFASIATVAAHQAVVRERLQQLHKNFGLPHVKETLRMVELLWARKECTRRDPRLLSRIMEESNRHICFF